MICRPQNLPCLVFIVVYDQTSPTRIGFGDASGRLPRSGLPRLPVWSWLACDSNVSFFFPFWLSGLLSFGRRWSLDPNSAAIGGLSMGILLLKENLGSYYLLRKVRLWVGISLKATITLHFSLDKHTRTRWWAVNEGYQ